MSYGNGKQNWVADILSNRPFIVGALFLSSFFLPFMILVAVPLLYIFRREPGEEWALSHYRYLSRTFWLAFGVISIVATIGLIAIATAKPVEGVEIEIIYLLIMLTIIGVFLAQFGVRSVLSLSHAVARQPMPRRDSSIF